MAVKTLSDNSKKLWETFVATTGKTAEDLATKLEPVVGDITDDTMAMLGDVEVAPNATIEAALAELKIPAIVLNMAIKGLRTAPAATPAPVAMAPMHERRMVAPAELMLVAAPGDDDLLKALQVGGKPTFDPINLAALVRAASADRLGVFGLPESIYNAIRAESRRLHVPNPPILAQVRREINRRTDLAQIFADLYPEEGKGGSAYVTEQDIKTTLEAMQRVWPAFIEFQMQLRAFRQEAWMARLTAGYAMGPGMGGPDPMGLDAMDLTGATLDTTHIVDAVSTLVEALNLVFEDQGLYASRVLGERAARLTKIVQMDGLQQAVGATSQEDMLRSILKVGITREMINQQTQLVTWVVNVMTIPDKDPTSLPRLVVTLANMGDRLPWDKLSNDRVHLEPAQPFQLASSFQPPAPPPPRVATRGGGAGGSDNPRGWNGGRT